ncbi:MAG: tetratricopeptide repeat protein [Cyclobacteriaceae bacterium]
MQYAKIILTIGAILIAIGIYFLPKVVVDNDKKAIAATKSEAPSQPATDSLHQVSIPDQQLNRLEGLVQSLKGSENNKKSAIFADSLAQTYASIRLWDSATVYGALAVELDPDLNRWIAAGNYYQEAYSFAVDQGEREVLGSKARDYYQRALNQQPDLLDVKANMALTYLPEQVMKGVLMLREVAEADPTNELAQYNLGLLSLQSQQLDKAQNRFEQLVRVNPNHLEGQFYLGVVLFELGKEQEAEAQFLKVKEIDGSPEVGTLVDDYLNKLDH